MDDAEKKYMIEAVKKMIDNNANICLFKFLIYHSDFVESNEKFKVTTITKAKEFLGYVDKYINEATNDIKKKRYTILKQVCQDYLEKFDQN